MIKIEIINTRNRSLDDFVFVQDIIENENGVIDITVRSERFKYWQISHQSGCSVQGTSITINNMVHYEKGTLYTIDDWYDVDDDTMDYETFDFDVIFDENERNDWKYYDCFITPLKYEYEVKLVPRKLIETFGGKELDWEEIVIVDGENKC